MLILIRPLHVGFTLSTHPTRAYLKSCQNITHGMPNAALHPARSLVIKLNYSNGRIVSA